MADSGGGERRRRFAPKASTSLLALLHAVAGRKLIFELRNDVIITGRLASVDDHMKCAAGGLQGAAPSSRARGARRTVALSGARSEDLKDHSTDCAANSFLPLTHPQRVC